MGARVTPAKSPVAACASRLKRSHRTHRHNALHAIRRAHSASALTRAAGLVVHGPPRDSCVHRPEPRASQQTTARPSQAVPAPPTPRAPWPPHARLALAIQNPHPPGSDLSTLYTLTPPGLAAPELQAQPCVPGKTWLPSQKALKNDTPDAIADCRPCGPQSQAWRGFTPTTPHREADHGQTTALATH